MVFPEHVDLVELSGKVRLVSVSVWLPFGKADQFAVRGFNDETEPAPVRGLERLAPLILADLVTRPVLEYRRMRLVERHHVKAGQGWNVRRCRFPDGNRLHSGLFSFSSTDLPICRQSAYHPRVPAGGQPA